MRPALRARNLAAQDGLRGERAALARRLRAPKSAALLHSTLQLLRGLDEIALLYRASGCAGAGEPDPLVALAHSVDQIEAAVLEVAAMQPQACAGADEESAACADDMSDAV